MDLSFLANPEDQTEAEKTAALAAALRKQQSLGMLGLLSGDPVLAKVAAAQLEGAEGQQRWAQEQGRLREGSRERTLDRALKAQEFGAQMEARREDARQRALDRSLQRQFQAEQARLARQAQEDAKAANRQAREDIQKEKVETREGEKLEKDVQAAGKELQDTADLAGDVRFLGKVAREEGTDAPGLGFWDSIKPEWLSGADDIAVRQRIQRLIGQQVKATTGATATPEEMKRIAGSYGLNAGTEATQKAGLLKLEADTANALATRQARFRPEVIQTLKERGGTTAEDLLPPLSSADQEALAWAEANPTNPDARTIRERLGR